ncbi:hypothetical protein LCGC14_1112140, partial [marine sediment metagenome]
MYCPNCKTNVLTVREDFRVGLAIILVDNVNQEYKQPSILVSYQGQNYEVKLRYLYLSLTDEFIDFGSGIEGGAYVFQRIVQQSGQNVVINPKGAAMFLSPRNMRALWVRLYLLEEGKNFELVHSESPEVVKVLKSQGLDIRELVYFNGINGPIKIWKVNYVGDEKHN